MIESLAERLFGLEPRDPPTDKASSVVMVTGGERPFRRLLHVPEAPLVDEFCDLLRSRRAWLELPGTSDKVRILCAALLQYVGLKSDARAEVARAGTVQLTFNPGLPALASEFPWEFVLTEATRPLRRTQFLVYRYLQTRTSTTRSGGAVDTDSMTFHAFGESPDLANVKMFCRFDKTSQVHHTAYFRDRRTLDFLRQSFGL